eukprot:TRINITY_DN26471_c0_g1_i1.p1 TRINITY_DN26471_c0_g1~~TRINITY_DN26471_c0_g1_i1.p1  ORF type:complete len:104 (-),score=13.59 TRINITY_DN26471_c0_g1_i1:33-302(-)
MCIRDRKIYGNDYYYCSYNGPWKLQDKPFASNFGFWFVILISALMSICAAFASSLDEKWRQHPERYEILTPPDLSMICLLYTSPSPRDS